MIFESPTRDIPRLNFLYNPLDSVFTNLFSTSNNSVFSKIELISSVLAPLIAEKKTKCSLCLNNFILYCKIIIKAITLQT
jgi:hypothetical protein